MLSWLTQSAETNRLKEDAFSRFEYGRLGSPLRGSASRRYVKAIEAGRLELSFQLGRNCKTRNSRGSAR